MREILINEICNEKPNSAALGAFNASIGTGGGEGDFTTKKESGALKTIGSENKKAIIYQRKSRTDNGYEYNIVTLKKGMFGGFQVDDSVKKKTIRSKKEAINFANNYVSN